MKAVANMDRNGNIANRIHNDQVCLVRGDRRYMPMSETTLNNIRNLFDNIGQHSAMVEERMRDAGMTPDPALVESMAKYWDALEKLAAE